MERDLKNFSSPCSPPLAILVYRERNHASRAIRLEQSSHNGRRVNPVTTVEVLSMEQWWGKTVE